MTPDQLLQQMHDIYAPPAVGWWPPAPGWWVVAALVLAALVGIALLVRKRRQRRQYRSDALLLLDAEFRQRADAGDTLGYLQRANELLRRIARKIDPAAAQRSGAAWREWLDALAPGVVSEPTAHALSESIYTGRQPQLDLDASHAELRIWVQRHRPPRQEASDA